MADTETLITLIGIYDNFDEPEPIWNRTSTMMGLAIPFVILSWVCVVFRLYARLKIIRAPGLDDLFLVLFLLSGTMNGISLCLASQYGFGKHLLLVPYDELLQFLRAFYVENATYCMSTTLIKLSLLFQYLRIFSSGITRIICIALIAMVAAWGFAFSLLAWVPCVPVSLFFNWVPNANCWAFGSLHPDVFFATYTSHAVLNMFFDFLVLSVPVQLYFSRETAPSARWRLLALLSVGTFVSCISIWRLVVIVDHRAATWPTFDPTWYGPPLVLLGMIEVNVASICACVPVFWPILSARMDRIFVTQEIKITSEQRFSEIEDEMELQNADRASVHSRSGSDSQRELMKSAKMSHYADHYIMDQVDPLRGTNTVTMMVSSEGKAEKGEKSPMKLTH